ncbi:MAG: hypothetical protein MK081_15780 [Flavobacteriales bacterium]|nr:hypothetical protein [Flavobacteriales bacterium]
MRRLLLLGVALLTVICVHAQHGLRLQNSYFLTGLPLFGAGYEYENNSSFTYGLHVEFGRYAHHQQDMINTAWESYSVQGVALLPEVRFYPWHDNQESVHRGVFIAGFGHARRLKEYLMEDPSVGAELRKGYSIGGGLAAGYRTACEIPHYTLKCSEDLVAPVPLSIRLRFTMKPVSVLVIMTAPQIFTDSNSPLVIDSNLHLREASLCTHSRHS